MSEGMTKIYDVIDDICGIHPIMTEELQALMLQQQ